jgi:sulfopyruvate decarboxylase subunit beta
MKHKPPCVEVMNLTREATGIGLLFGRSLAKKRSALIIQSTGIGNLVTELFTLQKLYQEALPIFLSWRGYYKEPIEAQRILGVKVPALLEAMDIEYKIIESETDLEDLKADVCNVFDSQKVKVYLLSPQIWETSAADYHVTGLPRMADVNVSVCGYHDTPSQTRFQAIELILHTIPDHALLVAQIGFPAKEVYNAKDRPTNFYMLGALGSASEVGIGLALNSPDRHVYVIDGDGSFFFNPNQFFDLNEFAPTNLTVIILDNGSWGSTGNQPTLSSSKGGINLSAVAQSVGILRLGRTAVLSEMAQMLRDKNVLLIHFMVLPGNNKEAIDIPLSAVEIKDRFMKNIE